MNKPNDADGRDVVRSGASVLFSKREYVYKITLHGGCFGFASNAMELERYICDRWRQVESIIPVPVADAHP